MLKPRDTNKFSTKIFKRLGCGQSETHFNENTLAKLEYLLNQITPGIKIIDSRFDASKLTHLLLSRVETDPLKNEKCSKLGLNNFLLARFTQKSISSAQKDKTKLRDYSNVDVIGNLREPLGDSVVYERVSSGVDPSVYLNKIKELEKRKPRASTFSSFRNYKVAQTVADSQFNRLNNKISDIESRIEGVWTKTQALRNCDFLLDNEKYRA